MQNNNIAMKSFILLIFTLLSCGCAYALCDFSAVAPSGQTLYYVINLDETTVSVYYPGVVYGYRDYEVPTGDVVIPETVTHDGTTYRVTTIANYAFYSCEQLTSVTIPASVTLIGEGVFFGCTALRHVSIPESVTNMAPYVFYSCSSLQSVELPQSLTYMGDGMFCSCTSLKEVAVPELIDSIPLRCFYHCDSLRTVLLPEGLTSIDESAFSDCFSLDSMVLPQNITSIGKKAFYNCRNLKMIELPQMLVSMGEESFAFCSKITTLELSAQLSAIGRRAFYCCNGLAEITSLATIPPKAEDDAFYNVVKSIPVNVPLGSAQDYRSAAIWEDFTNITDGSTVSIGRMDAEDNCVTMYEGKIMVNDESNNNQAVSIYDVNGRLLFASNTCHAIAFAVPNTGIYLVKIGTNPARKMFCKTNY